MGVQNWIFGAKALTPVLTKLYVCQKHTLCLLLANSFNRRSSISLVQRPNIRTGLKAVASTATAHGGTSDVIFKCTTTAFLLPTTTTTSLPHFPSFFGKLFLEQHLNFMVMRFRKMNYDKEEEERIIRGITEIKKVVERNYNDMKRIVEKSINAIRKQTDKTLGTSMAANPTAKTPEAKNSPPSDGSGGNSQKPPSGGVNCSCFHLDPLLRCSCSPLTANKLQPITFNYLQIRQNSNQRNLNAIQNFLKAGATKKIKAPITYRQKFKKLFANSPDDRRRTYSGNSDDQGGVYFRPKKVVFPLNAGENDLGKHIRQKTQGVPVKDLKAKSRKSTRLDDIASHVDLLELDKALRHPNPIRGTSESHMLNENLWKQFGKISINQASEFDNKMNMDGLLQVPSKEIAERLRAAPTKAIKYNFGFNDDAFHFRESDGSSFLKKLDPRATYSSSKTASCCGAAREDENEQQEFPMDLMTTQTSQKAPVFQAHQPNFKVLNEKEISKTDKLYNQTNSNNSQQQANTNKNKTLNDNGQEETNTNPDSSIHHRSNLPAQAQSLTNENRNTTANQYPNISLVLEAQHQLIRYLLQNNSNKIQGSSKSKEVQEPPAASLAGDESEALGEYCLQEEAAKPQAETSKPASACQPAGGESELDSPQLQSQTSAQPKAATANALNLRLNSPLEEIPFDESLELVSKKELVSPHFNPIHRSDSPTTTPIQEQFVAFSAARGPATSNSRPEVDNDLESVTGSDTVHGTTELLAALSKGATKAVDLAKINSSKILNTMQEKQNFNLNLQVNSKEAMRRRAQRPPLVESKHLETDKELDAVKQKFVNVLAAFGLLFCLTLVPNGFESADSDFDSEVETPQNDSEEHLI